MKNKKNTMGLVNMLFVVGMVLAVPFNPFMAVEPKMGDYIAVPIILSSTIKPNVMILQDNSSSMLNFAYDSGSSTGYDPNKSNPYYEGIFKPDKIYRYDAVDNYFYEYEGSVTSLAKGSDYWEGKFLNWVCSRRLDIGKVVLTGGDYLSIVDKDNKTVDLIRTQPYISGFSGNWETSRRYNYDNDSITDRYRHGSSVDAKGAYFQISTNSGTTYGNNYYIRVKVLVKPEGIIQGMGKKVRFGLATYTTKTDVEGGKVVVPFNMDLAADETAIINNIVTKINSVAPLSDKSGNSVYTPMGESFFTVMGYFGQKGTQSATGPMYHTGDYKTNVITEDPYGGSDSSCIKSFVILISDGQANNDTSIASPYMDALPICGTCPVEPLSSGDHYLDNVAYYAHTHNLRDGVFGKLASGTDSTLTLYTIYTFGDGTGTPILQSAAKWGGFEDSNNNNLPDIKTEWTHKPGDIPDNYFETSSASELKTSLESVLLSILCKVSSGSAISMISTNSQGGEGTIVQAYFRPSLSNAEKEIEWVGYLQSFWVDDQFNLREDQDTDSYGKLDIKRDKIIRFETVAGDTKIRVIDVDDDNPYGTGSGTIIELTDPSLKPIWDAGKKLQNRSPDDRKIFTFLDADKDGIADDSDTAGSHVDNSGEVRRFNTDMTTLRDALKPYLGVISDTDWYYLDSTAGAVNSRVVNLVDWIRGKDSGFPATTEMRSRTIDSGVWKLGDIINSTPTTVGNPQQRYDVLYSDLSYTEFRKFVRGKAPAVPNGLDRETVVYVGANDGMLHAFTAGTFDPLTSTFIKGPSNKDLGEELWAYIPQALLPHLKWLPAQNYDHVYYVDQTPVIMDVRIFTPDPDKHPNGWGTILLCGLNWGGKNIQVYEDFGSGVSETQTFSSSYFCLDITNPLQPRVLWERSYANLGLTTSIPAIVRVGDDASVNKSQWFAVFGSGPTDFKGVTDQAARIFVVDLKTGEPYTNSTSIPKDPWLYRCTTETAPSSGIATYGYMNSPVSYDKYLDYNVDGIYFGETYRESGGSWKGKIWKFPIPYQVSDPSKKETDPKKWTPPYSMLNFNAPIAGAISVGVGKNKASHVFFGTGRYIEDSDKTSTTSQYLVGLIDPEDSATTYNLSDLWRVGVGTGDLAKGWYYGLPSGERSLTKPLVYAGCAIFATFKPSNDICGYGGNGYLYINNFYNGTLFSGPVDLGTGNPSQPIIRTKSGGKTKIDVLGRSLGLGDNSAIAISQSSSGAIVKKDISLISVPRSRFLWWREP